MAISVHMMKDESCRNWYEFNTLTDKSTDRGEANR